MNILSFLFGKQDPNSIKPKAAQKEFEKRVRSAGLEIQQLTLSQGVDLMLDFYREVRADKCPLDGDGDMLLFEWGTWKSQKPIRFQVAVTRQFMRPSGEDEDISQLQLVFRYDPTPETEALGKGNQWCHGPDELPEFESFVRESGPFLVCGDGTADNIEYYYQDGV